MKFQTSLILAGALFMGIFISACGGAATNTGTTNTAANKSNTTTTTAPANTTGTSNTETAKTDTAPAGDSVGVPECDEYIKKYEACLTKIAAKAPQVEGPLKTSFETLRDSWKKAAATPAGKSAMATGCKQALDSAKSNPALSAYACEW